MDAKIDTVDTLIDHLQTKLDLLKEWRECKATCETLAAACKFEESDNIDNRRVEIEDHFVEEYGISFDSYGDIETRGCEAEVA